LRPLSATAELMTLSATATIRAQAEEGDL
jgi:hypothetical protein